MTRTGFNLLAAILLATSSAFATETKATPDFKEVYNLVREHLTGATDVKLNRAAVEGLISSLGGKVAFVNEKATATQTNGALVSKAVALDNEVAYLRVSRVAEGLADDMVQALQRLNATNQIKGIVLDLRFADGQDYPAVVDVADLFLNDEKPLLDCGNGMLKSQNKYSTIKLPVAVLVNHETKGAAEALAAVLREAGAGLMLGSRTAGLAMVSQEFTLRNGQQLRIATAPVKLGDGKALSPDGVKPDIEIPVAPERERVYFKDPYAQPATTNLVADLNLSATNELEGTNPPTRRSHTTEADLVRARREGISLEEDTSFARDTEPQKPLIRDPVLGRAVDLLKGLAVVRQPRP